MTQREEQESTAPKRIRELVERAEPDVQRLLGEVLRLEKAHISQKSPRGIPNSIVDITKRIVT